MAIKRNDPCPCGSGKKYKKCHGLFQEQDSIFDQSLPPNSALNKALNQGKIKQCIHPDKERCKGKIVKAHSIQNNKILNKIAKNGEVYMVKSVVDSGINLKLKFKLIGRSVATTFTGFCGFHDKTIFEPIEDQDYIGTKQQNFLFAYRVFSFEYHKKMEAYEVHKNSANKKPSLLEDKKYLSQLEGYELSLRDNKRHKDIFDQALFNNDYSIVETVSFRIPSKSEIAVCSGFFLEYDIKGKSINRIDSKQDDMSLLMLTVFPQDNETVVLFSWLNADAELYSEFKEQILGLTPAELVQLLNNLIPSYCENVVYNPDFIKSLSDENRAEYLQVFNESIWTFEPTKRNLLKKSGYNLFPSIKS